MSTEERPRRDADDDEPGFDRPGEAGEPLSEDHEPAETEGDAPGGAGPGNPPQREQPGL